MTKVYSRLPVTDFGGVSNPNLQGVDILVKHQMSNPAVQLLVKITMIGLDR